MCQIYYIIYEGLEKSLAFSRTGICQTYYVIYKSLVKSTAFSRAAMRQTSFMVYKSLGKSLVLSLTQEVWQKVAVARLPPDLDEPD